MTTATTVHVRDWRTRGTIAVRRAGDTSETLPVPGATIDLAPGATVAVLGGTVHHFASLRLALGWAIGMVAS